MLVRNREMEEEALEMGEWYWNGIWRYGVGSVGLRLVDTDVSEKHNVSIFGAEDRNSVSPKRRYVAGVYVLVHTALQPRRILKPTWLRLHVKGLCLKTRVTGWLHCHVVCVCLLLETGENKGRMSRAKGYGGASPGPIFRVLPVFLSFK
jgi:hypothetical protein